MSQLNILLFPDPRLKKVAEPIKEITSKIKQLADDMLETMYEHDGVGLAATQVDRHVRLLVMDVSLNGEEPLVLINPEVTKKSGSSVEQEGCLSFPNAFAKVKRPSNVTCSYKDLSGTQQTIEADGLLARCIQHEIDHLNGVTFFEYLSPLKKTLLTKKIKKALKEVE